MISICEKDECTGCGACANVCHFNAIRMETDENDFLFPVIDSSKCIECNNCIKVCPNNIDGYYKTDAQEAYALWNKNKSIRFDSSSGGVFSGLAEAIINAGGSVVGVRWGKDWEPEFAIANDEMYKAFKGSKYVQPQIRDIYRKIQNQLDNGKIVLFSGTPCQCMALKRFLKKDYDKLYIVDFCCHGYPNYSTFRRYLNEICDNDITVVRSIKMRYKKPEWIFSSFYLTKNKGLFKVMNTECEYFRLFTSNYSLRSSCHQCKYTSLNRQGDITMSDFWGYTPNSLKMLTYRKGVSALLVNTEKGKKLFEQIKMDYVYEKVNCDMVVDGNRCFSEPFPVPTNIEEYWTDYRNGMTIHDLYKKYIKDKMKRPLFHKLKLVRLEIKNAVRIIVRDINGLF